MRENGQRKDGDGERRRRRDERGDGKDATNLMRRGDVAGESMVLGGDDLDEVSTTRKKQKTESASLCDDSTSCVSPGPRLHPLAERTLSPSGPRTHWNMYWLSSVCALTPVSGSWIPSFFLTWTILSVIVDAPWPSGPNEKRWIS